MYSRWPEYLMIVLLLGFAVASYSLNLQFISGIFYALGITNLWRTIFEMRRDREHAKRFRAAMRDLDEIFKKVKKD